MSDKYVLQKDFDAFVRRYERYVSESNKFFETMGSKIREWDKQTEKRLDKLVARYDKNIMAQQKATMHAFGEDQKIWKKMESLTKQVSMLQHKVTKSGGGAGGGPGGGGGAKTEVKRVERDLMRYVDQAIAKYDKVKKRR